MSQQEETKVPDAAADIAAFDTVAGASEGSVMEVRSPKTGEVLRHADGRPFTVTYYGRDSESFRNAARAINDRRIAAARRTNAPVLSAVIEKDDIELTVAATKSWDILLGGKAPASDPKEYRAVYTKYPWLKEQGDEHIGLRANFIKD